MKKSILAIAALGALLGGVRLLSRGKPEETFRRQWPMMGTIWSMEIIPHGKGDAAQFAYDEVLDELRHIDAVMSEWKPDSPISVLNNAAGKSLVEIPNDLRDILVRSIAFSEASDGAFDITWRGMGRIWRFDDQFRVPTKEAIEKARALVNYRDLRIEGNRAGLTRQGMSIGLGGIAKGYAIDRAAQILRNAGFQDFLVDGGGDVLVSGTRLGRPWRLGVQDPRAERGVLLGTLQLTKGVLVTSGDYERFRIVDGVRYHHIIDPKTGYPATASQSVTLIADTAERAVVLAKVIFIHGPERGLALARKEGLEALVIDKDGRSFSTPGFDRQFTRSR